MQHLTCLDSGLLQICPVQNAPGLLYQHVYQGMCSPVQELWAAEQSQDLQLREEHCLYMLCLKNYWVANWTSTELHQVCITADACVTG